MAQSRISPVPVVLTHFRGFRGPRKTIRGRDILEQVVVPLVLGAVSIFLEIELSEPMSAGILAITGIASAFCFHLSIQLLDRAANWADSSPTPGHDTTTYASLIEELSANTLYAAYVAALAAVAAFLAGITEDGWPERMLVCVAAVLAVHFVVSLMLVMARVFLLTRARLNISRTGTKR